MQVLVIGKGAREHALCWRLNQSPSVWGLFCAPGNPGTAQHATNVDIAAADIAALVSFARDRKVDLTVVGPEEPLAAGIVDEFAREGLSILGPTAAAARLESSKVFAKNLMKEAGVPTAAFAVFDDAEAARRHVRAQTSAMVVKADGLALGKGVVVCDDAAGALAAIDEALVAGRFGPAGRRIVIEERVRGEELSFFALSDGRNAIPLGLAQDHKAIFDGDRGPNTGGMGACSPVPPHGPELEARLMREVVHPTLAAMDSRGAPFRGVLFVGLMLSGDRISVIEFNARFGDPESQALMMRVEGDFAQTLLAAAVGHLERADVRLSSRCSAAVVLASGGYPGEYRKGLPITGLEHIEGGAPSEVKVKWALDRVRIKVFHGGTALRNGALVTNGGRVLTVTASAERLPRAIAAAYEAADMISFEGMQMRRDIGAHALRVLGES